MVETCDGFAAIALCSPCSGAGLMHLGMQLHTSRAHSKIYCSALPDLDFTKNGDWFTGKLDVARCFLLCVGVKNGVISKNKRLPFPPGHRKHEAPDTETLIFTLMDEFNPFLLIAPTVMAFLACALLLAWRSDRQQKSLCLMGLAILSTSGALAAQCMLTAAAIEQYAVFTAIFYLAGAWLCGQSMAHKFEARFHSPSAWVVSGLTLCGIFYFSKVLPNLSTRAYILSIGLGILHFLPFFNIIKTKIHKDIIDTYLYWFYLIFCFYTVARPITLFIFEHAPLSELVRSIYWFVTLLGSILFSMAVAFLLLASSVRKTLRRLHLERDLDPLTQLLNRRAFEESVASVQQQASSQPCSVLMVDIDHFKRINDTWGHDYGDQVLRNVGQCLREATRGTDLAARYGGEEFVLLLPRTSTTKAAHIAQRIQQQLARTGMRLPDNTQLTMSMGISTMEPEESFFGAFKRADQALYQAKNTGRDRICLAEIPTAPNSSAISSL